MRTFRFHIYKGPDCWLICAAHQGGAIAIWMGRAGFIDGTKVGGRPDKIEIERS